MKEFVVNGIINYVQKKKEYTQIEIDTMRYGIANLYLQLTKMIVITALAIIFKIFVPYILFMFFFNIIRSFAFGLHAKKSWQCWISSILIFIGGSMLIISVDFNNLFKIVISIITILFIYKYSPADTEKRPIISKKRRNIYKFISTLISIIYAFLILYLDNKIVVNCLLFSLILQSIIISPVTYKIFGLTYNNYIKFQEGGLSC